MSMIKYCGVPTHDEHGERTVISISPKDMNKTAGYDNFGEEMREFLASLKPEEGYAYLLIAAMGDQNWGPNRNGDYWPTLALSNPTHEYGYKTYETNGNWYHHHQNKDPNLAFGKVIKSVWNDMMGRIELVAKVDLNKDEKTRRALDDDAIIETSMGARVRYDICKVCHPNWREFYKIPEEDMIAISKENDLIKIHEIGKKHGVDLTYITKLNKDGGPVGIHSNITKYCHHMRTQRNQVLPGGEWVCVINLRPIFFDISFVSVNADKSSFVLAKVASEISEYPSEDIEEEAPAAITPPAPTEMPVAKSADQVENHGDGEINKEIEGGKVIADKLDDIEKYYADCICPAMYQCEQEMPDELMGSLAKSYSFPEILSSFLAMGMFPHPREFQRIVMIQMGKDDELAKADADKDYLRMSDVPDLSLKNVDGNYPIGLSPESVNPEIMNVLKHYFWERSNYRQPMVKRMVLIKRAGWLGNGYLSEEDMGKHNRSLAPALLGSLGTLYAISALEGQAKIGDIVKSITKPSTNNWLGAKLGLAIAGAILAHKAYGMLTDKTASASSTKTVVKWVGPGLATYLAGGYIINKARSGKPITKPEEIIAKHPVPLAIASTLAVNKPKNIVRGSKKVLSGIGELFKKASMGIDMAQCNIDELPIEQRDLGGIAIWQMLQDGSI